MHRETSFFTTLHSSLLQDISYNYHEISTIYLDLVTIMGAIYYKDVLTPKQNDKPRLINIDIPVFNIALLGKQEIIELLQKMAKWVSEDNFNINFHPITLNRELNYINSLVSSTNDVTLFSGGLDSFAGAFHNYKNGIKSDYLGFINKGEEKTKQLEMSKFYKEIFDASTEIVLVEKPIRKKVTYIQSTRSLLYLALAVSKAYFNSAQNVYIYENGILSLNPEIKNRYTTKTTHPKTIFMYEHLLRLLGISIKINHPFLFKTKGQIINDMDVKFKVAIKQTFTCGQGRSHPERSHNGQCGICIPCLLRKISLAAYNNEKYDVQYEYPYETKISNIKEELYKKDYESNLSYFDSYYRSIKANRIHLEVHTREKYYSEKIDFRLYNQTMFNTFVQEYERFMELYAPY
ncbi:7-cyano-7-deazaguanine synthase [Paenibacillus lautus]|uniref:7-cyano-7-deazaguanine synthase n=1 Tax=Paenibacillus lautus TaxID=1401 RepID=UPI003D2C03B3